MADGITIDVKNFSNLKGITALKDKIGRVVDDVLNKGADDVATMAQQLAPKDIGGGGGLSSRISADKKLYLEKHVIANAFYAPFMEFGTGKYAAEEVAKLPADWQQYAATFRGKKEEGGGGTAYDLFLALIDWVHRHSQFKEKAVTGIHSEKTGRRRGGKTRIQAEDEAAAYILMIIILKNGVRPHPFMFPSYEHFRPIIIDEVETALKGL